MAQADPWFKTAVVYQIYPRSFQDSNNDGVGDLQGIISRLDYLQSLGVGAIWLSPVYKSPMADFGYDVADYCDIDPLFGTLVDFDKLVEETHKRGMKIIMDFVPNHTSDQHSWFVESRSSRQNPKRDWYLWANGKDGRPPNNWLSVFGGSGWEWDEASKQYYFHSFLKQQPDLNWNNPEVRQAMAEALEFWLKRGVDGFRVDAIHHLIKDIQFRDEPPNPNFRPDTDDPYNSLLHVYSQGQEETFKVINGFCSLLEKYPDAFMVSEVHAGIPILSKYFKACNNGLHSPFNFNLIGLVWTAESVKKFVDDFEASLAPTDLPNYVLGNHDKPRVASRIGLMPARGAAMLLFTLRGMPFVYYGEELGMQDEPVPTELVRDPFEKNVPGLKLGRDPQRTPMQWNSRDYAGFSSVPPWLPINPNYEQINAEKELADSGSMLALYRRLISFRNQSEALRFGSFKSLDSGNGQVFAYTRISPNEKLMVVLNFSDQPQVAKTEIKQAEVVLSTYPDHKAGEKADASQLLLRPNEGYLLKIK